jgi:nucleotide-binding universal stress UspA family protein
MMSTVLVPTDLSAAQEGVMRFCTGLHDLGVARAVCCTVVDTTGLEGTVIAAKVEAARKTLERVSEPLVRSGLEVELLVPTGDPERELLAIASEEHIDAIVSGASGKTAADRLFIGSVSERLARDGGIPSLTLRYDMLRAAEEPAELARRFGRMLLVPTDFSATAARALNMALSLPKRVVGSIRLLNVSSGGAAADAGAEAELRKLVAIAKERGIHATPVIGHGAPERAILAEIDASGVSGVIVGSRGRSLLQEALLGSVSMTLIRQAPVPVLVVP